MTGVTSPERLVVAALRWEDGGRSSLGFVRGRFDALAATRLLQRHRVDDHELFLAPGETEGDGELALARLDEQTLVYGNVLAVLNAIELFQQPPCAAQSELRERFDEVDTSKSVWAVARGDWLDFDFPEEALESADIRGRSLSRSLTAIQALLLSAEVSSKEAKLLMRTRADDAIDAHILADALSGFISTARSMAPEAIRPSLERATVSREGTDVQFRHTARRPGTRAASTEPDRPQPSNVATR